MTSAMLAGIQLSKLGEESQGLDAKQISFLGGVFTTAELTSVEEIVKFIRSNFGVFDTVIDVTALESSSDKILQILDAGARKVVVTHTQLQSLNQDLGVDLDRLARLGPGSEKPNSKELQTKSLLLSESDKTDIEKCLSAGSFEAIGSEVFVNEPEADLERTCSIARAGAIPIVPAASLTFNQSMSPGQVYAPDLILARATSDREDGLFTTLVTDERGVALGLVYSSRESVAESLRNGRGVYQSRKRGLWYKGDSSGDIQELIRVSFDCDSDCILFVVRQKGRGFCHLGTATCFGQYGGLSKLQKTLEERKASAPPGSYTARLFNDSKLLSAKIKEEADELCEASTAENVAFEAADLLYFALTRCVAAGVRLEDVERNLDAKSMKVNRRKGDAKPAYLSNGTSSKESQTGNQKPTATEVKEAASAPEAAPENGDVIKMTRYDSTKASQETIQYALSRPSQRSTDKIMNIVKPIISDVQQRGDAALLEYTHKFEKALSLKSPVLHAPFAQNLMNLDVDTKEAIDISFDNIYKFHAAQKEAKPLVVETMPGVVCSRFARPIERVGLYVPGGTAVLPSTALMLGVPALVAGCKTIVLASPPRSDGTLTPEIVYAAHKVGASSIVLAGGAQAVAALAYGTESTAKVDKILGPGNQFVTAAKMIVSNDTVARVAIDMPAGPSEVLVVADKTSNPAFVAADLLSQAEHGVDSQVVLIAIDMSEQELSAVEHELHKQASALPRVDIVRGAINHSVTLVVKTLQEAMELSNQYAPEHLILQNEDADRAAVMVENAGSVFIGPWTPESVGDYSAGVNHSLPTYGYARQYSGVNLSSYVKHITSSKLTKEGLQNVGPAVMRMAAVEELEAHRRAVSIRLAAH